MPESGAPNPAITPQSQVGRLMDGFLTTQLLYVVVRLGVADVLAAGPQTSRRIAESMGCDPELLARVLRGLVLEDIFAELDDGRFCLTPLGSCLRDGVPGSVRGSILSRGDLYYHAAAGLLPAVLQGGIPFEHVHGERFFDHLARHPDHEEAFRASMASRSAQEAADVVAAYSFEGLERLVDVGGGTGILLAAILRAAPGLQATLVDRPAMVAEARRRLQAEGVAERCECLSGDFFNQLPAGADAYVLSRIIHDWDDEDAHRILTTCRKAMAAESRLLIIEALLPDRARDQPAVIRMDIHMLVLLGARERTDAEYRRLLETSGFHLKRVLATGSRAGLSVIEATLIGDGREGGQDPRTRQG